MCPELLSIKIQWLRLLLLIWNRSKSCWEIPNYRSWGCHPVARKAWLLATERGETEDGGKKRAEGEAERPHLSFSPAVPITAPLCRVKPRVGVSWPCPPLLPIGLNTHSHGKVGGRLKELSGAHGTSQSWIGRLSTSYRGTAQQKWVTLIFITNTDELELTFISRKL